MTGEGGGRDLVLCWDPRLRVHCRECDPRDPGLQDLARDMNRVMREHGGVGLAAPQVGDDRRVILIRRPNDPPARARVLVNPELVRVSDELVPFEEGCLSFPGIYRRVMRPGGVTVRYTDLAGQEETLEDDAFLARVVQHEIDHLDGILFIDHLGWWTRLVVRVRMTLRRAGLRI